MTTQEAYEEIRRYFLRPGAVLAKVGGQCLYRTPEGNKCAVGCLIPDELYDELPRKIEVVEGSDEYGNYADEEIVHEDMAEIEENGIGEILHINPELDEIINGDSEEGIRKLEFLKIAQRIHDTFSDDARDFVKKLEVAALSFGLLVNSLSRTR